MKLSGKFLGFLRLDLSQILVLSNIPGEIEELNGSILKILQEFIIPISNRSSGALHPVVAVMRKMPINGPTVHFLTFDQAGKALAIDLFGIVWQSKHFQNGGIKDSAYYGPRSLGKTMSL